LDVAVNIKRAVLLFATLLLIGSCKDNPIVPEAPWEIEMVLVKRGTFTMGSPGGTGNDDERPEHSVTVSCFYIGKYEITRGQWRDVVRWKQGNDTTPLHPDPSSFTSSDDLPVEQVSWNDIQIWLGYLNEREGLANAEKKYRLPTEAEWEYAARGGMRWADGYAFSGGDMADAVAWYDPLAGGTTHPVGSKGANQKGIHDMSGNVFEWCQDWYGPYAPESTTNPTGPASGTLRVIRGGGWNGYESYCRVAARFKGNPADRGHDTGFRILKVL